MLDLGRLPVTLTLHFLLSCTFIAQAWDQSDLEMFDLMEEMSTNFYDFLNVPTVNPVSYFYVAFL